MAPQITVTSAAITTVRVMMLILAGVNSSP
jgi:hypothetical protein